MSDFCGIYVFCTAKLKHLPIPLTTEVARILWQVSLKLLQLVFTQCCRFDQIQPIVLNVLFHSGISQLHHIMQAQGTVTWI